MKIYEWMENSTQKYPPLGILFYTIYNYIYRHFRVNRNNSIYPQNNEAIILIPGRHNNTNCYNKILEKDNLKKYNIYKYNYRTTAPLSNSLQNLIKFIDQIPETTINIISHSKGGLLAKSATLFTRKEINMLITLATPHNGTIFSEIPFIDNLEKDFKDFTNPIDFKPATKTFINIFPYFDQVIIPNKKLLSKYAINIKTKSFGHDSVLFSTEVIDLITDILEKHYNHNS